MSTDWKSSGRLSGPALLMAAMVAVSGCATFRLYDQSKDTAAKDVKARYGQVQLLTVVDTERKNLDALLQEELTVLREARRAGLDHDLLTLVDGARPIGAAIATTLETHTLSVENGQAKWTPATGPGLLIKRANVMAGGAEGIAALRKVNLATARYESFAGRVRDRAELIAEETSGRQPPACETVELDKAFATFVDSIEKPITKAVVERNGIEYRKACAELAREVGTGEIARAARAAEAARAAVKTRRAEAGAIATKLTAATAEYDAAVKAAKEADTGETRKRLEAATAALKTALAGADTGLSKLDIAILPEVQVQALDRILAAVASGQVTADKLAEPELARATEVAGTVASLGRAIATMKREGRSPGVSDLLIEKEHQILLRDYALRRTAFAEQRATLQEARYAALVLEADTLVEEHDALCTFMEKQAGADKRVDCDSLRIEVKQPPDAPVAALHACEFGFGRTSTVAAPGQRLEGAACPLAATWREALETAKPEAKRQLYRAVGALVRRRAIAATLLDEADLRLVDLAHREVLTADEYAVRAWNSLIATPINQLAAYYETGIKPVELADLIVKAIGLGAIAVGVNR